MALLQENKQLEIDILRAKANEYWDRDKEKYFELLIEAWNLYPEPKNNWHEAYSVARELFLAYLIGESFDEAKKWLNEMIANENNLHHRDEDCLFNMGKYTFCIQRYDEALTHFKEAVKIASFRVFEGANPKYLDFYKNPDKYIKK
jgi:tetratricopeptide (TPR) repeat protein